MYKLNVANLEKYRYSAIDLSPIANYILQPYWSWAVTLFPLWMAPNLITLLGFLFVIANFILSYLYSPDLLRVGPDWIYVSFAVGIFLYSTFDNVDGKQARRTGTSSALGEVFDHSIDALNVSMGAILQMATFSSGFGFESGMILAIATTSFFISTWETSYTKTMYLGYINGPTEGLLITVGTMLLSARYGPSIWKTKISYLIPSLGQSSSFEYVTLAQIMIYGMLFLLITTQAPVR